MGPLIYILGFVVLLIFFFAGYISEAQLRSADHEEEIHCCEKDGHIWTYRGYSSLTEYLNSPWRNAEDEQQDEFMPNYYTCSKCGESLVFNDHMWHFELFPKDKIDEPRYKY